MTHNKTSTSISQHQKETSDAKRRKKQSKKSNKYLISNIDNISIEEAKVLIEYCEHRLESSQACLVLLLSLLLGRTCNKIINEKHKFKLDKNKSNFNSFVFVDSPDITPIEKSQVSDSLEQSKGSVLLPLPENMTERIKHFLNNTPADLDFKNVLKKINNKFKTRLTVNRISRYMTHWMVNQNIDSTNIALLAGKSAELIVSLYYHRAKVTKLLIIYESFLNHLYDESKFRFVKKTKLYVGSNFVPTKAAIQNLFTSIKNTYNDANNQIDQHNAFVIYTVMLLFMATGHRPVTDPFGFLKCFCLLTGRVYLNEKNIDKHHEHRIIPLCNTAQKQLQNYIKYIEESKMKFMLLSKELNHYFNGIQDSSMPLFFLINNHKVIQISESTFVSVKRTPFYHLAKS